MIVGLGNPEPRYDKTRHNTGFDALDVLAERWGVSVNKGKWNGLYGVAPMAEGKVILLKPLTYMNLSGNCVGPAAQFYKIPPEHVIVLCDDTEQDAGCLRIRPTGSAGGHNGLKSIIAALGSQDFVRVRIGVGKKPLPEYSLADWVLGKFSAEDRAALEKRFEDIEPACRLIMEGRLQEAQSRYNTRKPKPQAEKADPAGDAEDADV